MAIYHLHVGIVSRKTGRSAVAAAAYRSADKLKNDYDGITHDYTNRSSVSAAAYRAGERLTNEQGKTHDFSNKRGVVHTEIMLPENALKEFYNRSILWNAVEKAEKRCDAQTARDIDIALPVELDRQEQIEIMREYIQNNFVKYGMCADFAIHDKGDGNPHAHILLTTRNVTQSGFGNKNRDWNKPAYLQSWRENWANICNEKLQAKGLDERIDHRTLKAQGIDREPTIHIGVAAIAMERAGRNSDRVKKCNEIISRNENLKPEAKAKYMHELKQKYAILDKEIFALKQESAEAQREMNTLRHRAEEITERAEQIQTMRERLAELKKQRQGIGVFTSRKDIDSQIQQIERSYEQATNYFKRTYDISPEEVAAFASQLEAKAKSKGHLQERLREKLTTFEAEKENFALEYQRQKRLAEISPDRQRIQDELARLTKEPRTNKQSVQDELTRTRSERTIDIVTRRNFQEVSPEQTKALIKQRERERLRERGRLR